MNNIVWNNWRDNLKEASFRGIPFKVMSVTTEGGRRTFLHKYPFNDEPYLEDFGKEPGVYRVEAYIVQSADNAYDYFPHRNLLIEALEEYGPGTLVHPFLGQRNVGVQGNYQLKESFTEGGIARFTITFVDAGRPQQPAAELPAETVTKKIDETQASALSKLGKALKTAGEIGYVVQSALREVQAYATAAQAALLTPLAVVTAIKSEARTTVQGIYDGIEAVINMPDQLVDMLAGIPSVFTDLIEEMPAHDTSLTAASLSMATTFGTDSAAITATTPDRQTELDNRNIVVDVVRCCSLAEAVRSALSMEYASYEDAVAVRNLLASAFDFVADGISENSRNDDLYQLLDDLRQFALDGMVGKGANLPAVVTYTVPVDQPPSLVYAQMLYRDIGREQEIIDRNVTVMRHPGFPLGGESLKVLGE